MNGGLLGFLCLVLNASVCLAQKPELVVQTGHSAAVSSVAFSPDSKLMASASFDRTVTLWDMATQAQLRTLKAHTHKVNAVAFGVGGRVLASGGNDGTVRLWDPATGQLLRTIQAHVLAIDAIAFKPDGSLLATGSFDNTIKLWDPTTGQEIRTLRGHTGGVASVVFSPDGKTLLSGSHDHSVRLWDAATGTLLRTFAGHPVAVMGVAFSADGRSIASSGGGIAGHAVVYVWNVATGAPVHRFETDDEWISSVAFSLDGNQLIGGSNTRQKALHLWDLRKGTDAGKLPTKASAIFALTFSPDGRWLAYGRDDNAIGLRNPKDWADLGAMEGHVHPITSVAWSRDGRLLASAGRSWDIDLWDLSRSTPVMKLSGHTSDVNAVAFSPKGDRLASASHDQTLRIWDSATGRVLQTLKGHASGVKCVAWSPDGKLLASGSWDTTVRVWDGESGELLRTLPGHIDFVRDLAFSPDGKTLASASGDTTIRLWDVVTGTRIGTLEGHTNWVEAVAFSPDGRLLASGSVDKTVKLWDLATRREVRTLTGHTAAVETLTFLDGGRTLASAGFDQTIRTWDVATGQAQNVLQGHSDAVMSLAAGDRAVLASGSQDAQIRFWDTASGKDLASLTLLDDRDWAVVDPQGRFDTNSLEEVKSLHWVMGDDPFTPLPVEIFMRDYYEPRLLPRLLNGEVLKPIRNLMDLNRAQPKVKITGIQPQPGGKVTVQVEVERGSSTVLRNGKAIPRMTDAYDVRLFRDGQLVAVSARTGTSTSDADLAAWRRVHRVVTPAKITRLSFPGVRLPRASGSVEFTAYAFNEDRVKSLTDRRTLALPAHPAAQGRAYVITVGVNTSDNPAWNLKYAANDARRIRQTLLERLRANPAYRAVVDVALISDAAPRMDEAPALKANLKTVLDLLAGRKAGPGNRIPGAERIEPATPEDLVLISFSGHGYTGERGIFYLLPEDVGRPRTEADLLKRSISSDELSEWLLDVDAGDMALVVDACHSAASVQSEGFKPGPMGSRGLGQLAFDKGMRILASSQADTAALESDQLQQGLLSYALVKDGLERKEADFQPKDHVITLSEWLSYGTQRVPGLYEEVNAGRLQGVRGINLVGEIQGAQDSAARRALQQPALFDFRTKRSDVNLEGP